MPTLGSTLKTLADIAKETDPDGSAARVAEVLTQTNAILEDVPWEASNLPTGHRSSIRVGLPTVSLRRINEGVASTKGTTSQITDGMSLIEAWSTVDKKLLDLHPSNAEQVRMNEDNAFVESMGQKMAELLIYGDETADEKEFNGLDVRYNSTSGNVADNVLDCLGTGSDQTSIWLVGWAPDKVFGIYPRGSTAGLQVIDHGLRPVMDGSSTAGGAKFAAYETQFCWDAGLVVKDWRYVVRIANVDVPDMVSLGAVSPNTQQLTDYATNIIYQMTRALHRIPNLRACRPVFYMTRTTKESFHIMQQALTNANVFKTVDVNGVPVDTFQGVPIKICDQILHAESAI